MTARISAPRDASYRGPGYNGFSSQEAMTAKQRSFIEKLQTERALPEARAEALKQDLEGPAGWMTKRDASLYIDELLAAPFKASHQVHFGPKQPPQPDVPAGRYAVIGRDGKLKFVKVDRPKDGAWAGWTFVKIQAGDDFHPLKGDVARRALEAIVNAGPQQASERYGRELGHCGICGRTLTDEDSRARGIGPVCAANAGW